MALRVAGTRNTRPLPVRKGGTVAVRTPPRIEQSLRRSGMDNTAGFGPGRPLTPYRGYSQPPRHMDYPVGVNIATSSRQAWGRASFDTLRAIIDIYDVARMCINYKIDELRSMELLFQPADGVTGDVSGAIAAARAVLEFPDRELPFDAWFGKWLENCLRYDAGTLYRRRNLAGEIIALEVVDGTTVLPYVDEHGRKPRPPDPAYFQLIHGLPYNWYTTDDMVQSLFRPQSASPFGLAPIETVLLTANTDLRFQWHFLQMFTEGSVPAGFIEVPPDLTSPDQVAEWQDYWDAMILGDQAKLHQLIAVPHGTNIVETKPKNFDPKFPEYLMARTCAAYGVAPQNLGLIQDVNRSAGEVQEDIQARVHTGPWVGFANGVLTRYLQRDHGLPVKAVLDTGAEKEDRLKTAQADKIYVDMGAIGPSDVRERVFGLPEPDGKPVPRYVMTSRSGPVPLAALYAVAGQVDRESAAPEPGAPLPTAPFSAVEGVTPSPPIAGVPLAVQQYGAPPAPAPTPAPAAPVAPVAPVAKEITAGVTADTGITGIDLLGEDEEDTDHELLVKAELAAFRRFAKTRAKSCRWRDFTFATTDPVTAHRLNDTGRAHVRKAAGQLVAAGLCVRATDTGRVLMLQRVLDPSDPAGGTWEFPGGHIEDGEDPYTAAAREWAEETGCPLPTEGEQRGSWIAGVYQGFVYAVSTEDDVPIHGERFAGVSNPDDPDGDQIEALAWWDPAQLTDNPAVRPELADALPQVYAALEENDPAVTKAEPAPGDPRWYLHRARQLEANLLPGHTDAIRGGLAAAASSDQLHAAATAYLAQRPGR
jgi:8-oxo-dGTP pyrophosphatase MutT (NUDIX family)